MVDAESWGTMASNKSVVDQAKLRQMMAKLKDRPDANSKAKKYKVSAATMALVEDEKRKKAKEKASAKPAPSAAPLPKDFFERQPKKGILKNSSAPPGSSATVVQQVGQKRPPGLDINGSSESNLEKAKKRRKQNVPSEDVEMKDVEVGTSEGESGTTLPEGFFDDPIKDAKARNIEYKDPAEEEWDRFQKEISQELNTAQDIVAEEQEEATVGRQLEEIDEQMRAWSRVSDMEKKFDVVGEEVQEKKQSSTGDGMTLAESDEDEVDMDELDNLSDWRKKC